MKQQLTFLLTVLMSMIGAKTYAHDIEVQNGDGVTIYYNYINNATELEVTYYSYSKKYTGDVVIPKEVTYMNRTRKVTRIGEEAFRECYDLTSVTIPNSMKTIGDNAFRGCDGLTSITIPNSVTNIGNYAFRSCDGLTSVTIPNSVTTIGEQSFSLCDALASVTIESGDIGSRAFEDCNSLTSVTIGNSVMSIGDNAFQECSGLTSITIPNSVTNIGDYAFYNCYGLTSITIGNGLKSIGYSVFSYCNQLKKVIVSDIAAWCGIKFGDNPLSHAHHLYSDENTEIKELTIPNGVTSIGRGVFEECYGLTSVTIPNSVTNIGDNAFWGCTDLTSVTIGNSVASIGSGAFGNCSGLTSVTIPNSVASIGSGAFYKCSSLTSVTIGSGVTSIGYEAFNEADIPTIISLIENPFAIYGKTSSNNTFTLNTFNNATLYVPYGTIDKYKVTEGWKDFVFIEEETPVSPVTYHLTYYIDGTEYKTYEIEEGAEITPEPEPTKEGYTFSGWSEIPETMPAHDVTVTGSFSINKYKLTYIVDGVEYKSYDVEYGAAITPDIEPTKEGYTFSGWSDIPETMPAHEVTVIGTFSINTYKLTYNVDGVEYKSYNIEYGAAVTPETEPAKEGYTFSGWSEIPATMPAHDVTVIGTFSINKYKLTYTVDGEVYKTYDIEYGATIIPEAEPTKEGYIFSGWSEIPKTMPAHDVTVTGTFSINKYKLTYVVDGEVYKTYEIEYGATITPESEPTKEGYTFSGWSEIPATMPAHVVTVTGSFSINSYKLTYTVDGEVYKTYDIEYGASITPEAEPTKEGYTFSGWSTIPTTMPAYDVTITGSFTKGAYKLTYMLDGVVYKTISYDYGDAITPEPAPTKEGYTFSGWSEIPETMPAHDVMVTGTFSINKYKLTYTVDGEIYKTYEMEYGATITPEAEPAKEGYTFSGWSTIPATMPAYDVTITGTFKVNKYKVNYFVDNNPYYTDMVEYGAIITPPNVPEREGYDFAWVYIPDTMPAYDISIYGQYTIKTGIEQIMSNANGDVMIFTIDGKRVDNLKKGMNVIRMKDGTTRKVVVK